MIITFEPLHESYFELLLSWLEKPHVKKWWDSDVAYTIGLVEEKYGSYVKGHKTIDGINKPMHGFIIHADKSPIGYIQFYNAYDFPRENELYNLPESLGALDIFIGEAACLNRKIGSKAVQLFLEKHAFKYHRYIFVDPDYTNVSAVKAYEKASFVIIKRVQKKFWMVTHKPIVRLSIQDSLALEVSFRKSFLKEDRLWLFGSRANLSKRGGDIDLYIETHIESVDDAVDAKQSFWINFEEAIGEQKIDIVLNQVNSKYFLPIHEIAKTKGVRIL